MIGWTAMRSADSPASQRTSSNGGRLSIDDISEYFNIPIAEPSTILGVCTSVLKRICRENGIVRWPYRKYLAGKSVDDIKNDAVKEKTKEHPSSAKQNNDVQMMNASVSAALPLNFGNKILNRTLDHPHEAFRSQQGSSITGNVLHQQGNRSFQHGMTTLCSQPTFRFHSGRFRTLFCRFYNSVGSPVLPHWFTSHGSVSDSDDYFVLPTNIPIEKPNTFTGVVKVDTSVFGNVDVDEVSSILKSNFESPNAVLVALGSCSVKISHELVGKILKRFSNDWVAAFGFFMWTSAKLGYKHSAESYDSMVDILGKRKQFGAMWGLVEEMNQHGSLVSLETMTKVIRRLARAGRWGDAIRTFRDLDRFGVVRDVVSMNVLLDSLCKERSVKHARDAFQEFKIDIPPNAASFNSLIHGWCKARKLEEAWKTLEEMRDYGFSPCAITYTSLIEAYCVTKNFRMVDDIIDKMHVEGCPPNVVTYTIVMHSLGKAMETQKALEIFDKMKRDGCDPDTPFYNSLIYIFSRSGRVKEADDIYKEMHESGISPNVTTYNTLISAACHCSDEQKALKLLLEMHHSTCKPNTETYAPLFKLCCRKKWVKILLYLLGHMFKSDISIDLGTYALLVRGLCLNELLEQACLLFEEMVLKGLMPKQHTYTILLESLERKHMDKAKSKVQELMELAQNQK